MAMMALMAGTAAFAQFTVSAAGRNVSICLEDETGSLVAGQARMLASKMFREIGVAIVWHGHFRNCSTGAILISLRQNTPANLKPGVLAYAAPYEGTHIRVFYDRICQMHEPAMVPTVLAHVLVHEITHILQGVSRHSEAGIMKAYWGEEDCFQMRFKPLQFAQEDIDLIYQGLAARSRRAMLAASTGMPETQTAR